jgi:uncharacterized protein involved in cysteine biosynthesis
MLDAALKALGEMFSPPFRMVLMKSVGLAILCLTAVAIALYRLLEWLSGAGTGWAEGALRGSIIGAWSHGPLVVLSWIIDFALGLGLLTGAVLLMPAATALAAGFFADNIAERVELSHYPIATAWLLGREHFNLAAMRFHTVAEARELRHRHAAEVFTAGLFIAGFVSIPILNLATPLFGTAFMVHVHKRLTRPRGMGKGGPGI